MSNPTPLLTLDSATFSGGYGPWTFSLAAGEAVVIQGRARHLDHLADAVQGLLEPDTGRVTWRDKAWLRMSPSVQAGARSGMRRVFRTGAWVMNLDLDENITLAGRHHGLAPVHELEEQARSLGQRFGLDPLPSSRPAWTEVPVLQKAQWVRALMGEPDLILLEDPDHGVEPDDVSGWLEALAEHHRRGAAILWMTSRGRLWDDERMTWARCFQLSAQDLEPIV